MKDGCCCFKCSIDRRVVVKRQAPKNKSLAWKKNSQTEPTAQAAAAIVNEACPLVRYFLGKGRRQKRSREAFPLEHLSLCCPAEQHFFLLGHTIKTQSLKEANTIKEKRRKGEGEKEEANKSPELSVSLSLSRFHSMATRRASLAQLSQRAAANLSLKSEEEKTTKEEEQKQTLCKCKASNCNSILQAMINDEDP